MSIDIISVDGIRILGDSLDTKLDQASPSGVKIEKVTEYGVFEIDISKITKEDIYTGSL